AGAGIDGKSGHVTRSLVGGIKEWRRGRHDDPDRTDISIENVGRIDGSDHAIAHRNGKIAAALVYVQQGHVIAGEIRYIKEVAGSVRGKSRGIGADRKIRRPQRDQDSVALGA